MIITQTISTEHLKLMHACKSLIIFHSFKMYGQTPEGHLYCFSHIISYILKNCLFNNCSPVHHNLFTLQSWFLACCSNLWNMFSFWWTCTESWRVCFLTELLVLYQTAASCCPTAPWLFASVALDARSSAETSLFGARERRAEVSS